MKKDDFTKRVFGNELKYVTEVLEGDFHAARGSLMMGRLEAVFAKRFGARFAIAHVNGTATLHAALEAAGIGAGDEVIVPPLTMSATTFAVLQCNATPVFADVTPDTFLIDPKSIERLVTPRTKGIVTVALYGLSPEMDEINRIARMHNLFVLEDNAQCFLGEYKGKIAGILGHASSFSFQSSKHLTSGEGGMVLTDDEKLADRIRRINSLGYGSVCANKGKITKSTIQDPNYNRHVSLGWNYRMPELCAAVALAQVENIDALVQRRIDVANLFAEVTRGYDWLLPQHVPAHCKHSYWTFPLLLDHPELTWHEFRDAFRANGGDGIYAAWQLTHLEPMFKEKSFLGRQRFIDEKRLAEYQAGLCPVAERLQPKLLQFKTCYWDWSHAEKQAAALKKTVQSVKAPLRRKAG